MELAPVGPLRLDVDDDAPCFTAPAETGHTDSGTPLVLVDELDELSELRELELSELSDDVLLRLLSLLRLDVLLLD